MAWRSLAPVRPGSLDGVQFWPGADRFFGLCPAGEGTTYGFGNLTCARLHESAAGRIGRLRERFADFGAPVQEYLAAVPRDADVYARPSDGFPAPPGTAAGWR